MGWWAIWDRCSYTNLVHVRLALADGFLELMAASANHRQAVIMRIPNISQRLLAVRPVQDEDEEKTCPAG